MSTLSRSSFDCAAQRRRGVCKAKTRLKAIPNAKALDLLHQPTHPRRGLKPPRMPDPEMTLNQLIVLVGHVPTPTAHAAVIVGGIHLRPGDVAATSRTLRRHVLVHDVGLKHIFLLLGQRVGAAAVPDDLLPHSCPPILA